MNASDVVCTTTFRQGDLNNRVEKVRAEVFLDTVHEITGKAIPFVAVYLDTQEQTLTLLQQLGVTVVPQQSKGMGKCRREAIASALTLFPEAQYICWLEPEKPDIIRFIEPMRIMIDQERSYLGLFNRVEMSSYPPEQAHYYLFCRAVATTLVGFDLDYAFGPMMMTRSVASYFLTYRGEYGDKWDSILVPRLRVIKSQLAVSVLLVDFQNDPRMTQVESGNPDIILKRLEQFNNVVPSLIAEWRKQ